MRLFTVLAAALALAAPAAAAGPRFAVYDLQSDLSQASRNTYGDVQVKPRAALHAGTLVRCGTGCRFGDGWLAFARPPHLAAADVTSASVRYTKRQGWTVRLGLTAAADRRWAAFARGTAAGAKLRGVPDVLVVVAGGRVVAAPLATEVPAAHGVVTLTGLSRASAEALKKTLS